jgi:hypothetical protein
VLIPADDYPIHQSSLPLSQPEGGHVDFYDRYFMNGYTEDCYFALAFGTYPNRGVVDAAFAVVADGVQRSVIASGRAPWDRAVTEIGPIRLEILEPMRTLRLTVDSPEHGLSADLTFTTGTPACEEERQLRYVGPRRVMDVTRATQLGRWHGSFSSGGTPYTAGVRGSFLGTKDHSWGVRHVGDPAPMAPVPGEHQLYFVWTPLHFDNEYLHAMVFQDGDGVPWSETGVLMQPLAELASPVGPALPIAELASIRHEVDWAPGLRRSRGGRVFLRRRPGDEEEVIHLEPLLNFRMSGIGYAHPIYKHGRWHDELVTVGESFDVAELDNVEPRNIHVQQVVRADWDGRVGLGIFEQMAMGRHAPSGFSGDLAGYAG